MTKRDDFTALLKEHKLDEYLNKLEDRALGDPVKMKRVILNTAWEWMKMEKQEGKKIIAKIIEVLTIDETVNYKNIEVQKQNKDEYK